MSRILAITNQKGGVGKTTTAINLAASLAACKRRVLLIDLDPQGNATTGCGVDKHAVGAEVPRSSYGVLLGECSAEAATVPAKDAGFWLIPANGDLTAAEVKLMGAIGREGKLKKALSTVRYEYDFVLIDCPPSLNLLTINALAAADGVFIPMQCEYYALEGLAALVDTIGQIHDSVNPKLEVYGILRTMFDPRNNLAMDVSKQLAQHFGDKVYRTAIPRNVRLAEAPSFGLPALQHDKASSGAVAYLALAGELIRREDAAKRKAAG